MSYESTSDSEQNSSKEMVHHDESDTILIAENRGNQLQSLNDQLQKENSKLRAQFTEAVRIAGSVDNIHNQNLNLSNEIRQIRSDKEDLEKRLQIALNSNEELNSKISEQKLAMQEQRRSDISSFQNELAKSETQAKLQQECLSKQILTMEEEKKKLTVDLKMSQNLLSLISDAASHYFQLTFQSIDELIEFLNRPSAKLNDAKENFQITNSISSKEEEIQNLQKQKSRLQKKLSQSVQLNHQLNEDIQSLKRQLIETEKSSLNAIDDLNTKIKQIEDDHQIVLEDHQHEKKVLNQKIESLQSAVEKYKAFNQSENSKCIQKVVPDHQSQNQTPKILIRHQGEKPDAIQRDIQIKAFETETKILKEKNQSLTDQNNKLEEKVKTLKNEIKELETEKEDLQALNDQISTNYQAQNLVHDSLVKEVETLRSVLRTQKVNEPNSEKLQKKIKKLKELVYHLEAQNQKLKEEENELQAQIEQKTKIFEHEIQQQQQQNDQLKLNLNKLNEENDSLNHNLSLLKMSSITNTPLSKHESNDFSIPLKIQELKNSYKEKFDQLASQKVSIENEKADIQKQFSEFLTKITTILNSRPILANDHKQILEAIKELNESYESSKQENLILLSMVKNFTETFHLSNTIDATIINSEISEFHKKLQKDKLMLKKRKTVISELQAENGKLIETNKNLNTQLTILQVNESQLKGIILSNEQEMEKLKRLIENQEIQLSQFDKIKEETEAEHQNQLNQIQMKQRKAESELREQNRAMAQNLEEMNNNDKINRQKIEKLEAKLSDYKAKRLAVTMQRDQIAIEFENKKTDLVNSFKKERENYEMTIKQLQIDADSQRGDMMKLSQQLSISANKLKKAKYYVKSMKKEQCDFNRNLAEEKDQLEREKQMIINNAKAQTLISESQYSAKLEENRSHYEKEKMKIFSFVADQFHQFFNPIEVIDESSFKMVVSRVKDELTKLLITDETVRKLVGADPTQKTEDAVALIVVGQ